MISKKYKYKVNNFLYLALKENFKKKINFNWDKYSQRFDIINKIIKKKFFKNYLKIVCFEDENFKKIIIDRKVGVDPISGGTIRLTSDEYFSSNKEIFDIIFIDGLHHFDQVKKDIINSLKILNKGGVILVHDCLPSRIRDQMVPRSHLTWNGDVWKALVEFRTKENLDVYTCLADQGLGIIFNQKNKNKLSLDKIDFKKLKFRDYYYNYTKYMNIISEEELLNMF